MEMAMAGNKAYLDAFYNDLKQRRFSVIISEPLFLNTKSGLDKWGDENNAWVNQISKYLLCNYKDPYSPLNHINIQLLVPRTGGEVNCQ